MSERDLCWMHKPVCVKELATFFLAPDDPISRTMIAEMPLLFSHAERIDSENDAFFLFRVVDQESLGTEGFCLSKQSKRPGYVISGQTTKALLYGMYRFYMICQSEGDLKDDVVSVPDQPIRMINHWDNVDGTIERGYAGDSIFYQDNAFRRDFPLIRSYARQLASIGVNALSINNVNVHEIETKFITDFYLPDVKMINDLFASFGIRLFLSVNFAAPMLIGDCTTADPLSAEVQTFWNETVANIYQYIPDFGGFLVKADSEGQPGPFAYQRGHDDGANMLARALAPFGGTLIWRCFVYNCKQDWRDRTQDRARASYDHFMKLDGKFDDNVILQIKLGPIDFQVREPVSPLFGGLKKTNTIIEFQITQEYTGHQIAAYYLAPTWKEALDFDTQYPGAHTVVKELIKYRAVDLTRCGIAAVSSVGMDANWTGNKLMQVNLFAYGRLCFDQELSADEMLREWIALSFSLGESNQEILHHLLMTSRETYVKYTTPFGLIFLCKPHLHYGPQVDGYEYDCWGTYHHADRDGIGFDRTIKTGTGYVAQYSDPRCKEYDSLDTCKDELLLFFHHVPYTHLMQSGKTVIQALYDSHFEGVAQLEQARIDIEKIRSELDPCVYENVRERLEREYGNAIEWRDQVNSYLYRKSGIPDEHGRTIFA